MNFYSYSAMDYDDVYLNAAVSAGNKTVDMPDKECFNGSANAFGKNEKIDELPLAMSYVPMQTFKEPVSYKEGFNNGTFFSELNLPYNDEVCIK